MPTYEYRCPECSNEFELFQKMSDEPVAPCTRCGKPAVRRLSGGAGLLFKGSGFYITDYARGDSYKKEAKAEGGSAPESKPAAESKPSSTSGGTPAKSE
jgi:putative FmdB family regulatory protein